jgi:hypothetical protein
MTWKMNWKMTMLLKHSSGKIWKTIRDKGMFHRQCWTSRYYKTCYGNCGRFSLFFSKELTETIVQRNRYVEQFHMPV